MNRSDNMKRIRKEYYDKFDPETRTAWRRKGGLNNVNRYKFTSEKASEAGRQAWRNWKDNKKLAKELEREG